MSLEDLKTRTLWLRKIAQLNTVIQSHKLSTFDGSLREQPFGILLLGPPGCGKSSLALKLSQTLSGAIGKPLASDQVVILNESDDFQSEYRSNHRVVIFDDLNATPVIQETRNPFYKIIDFINNIRKTSLNPHLELKGNIKIQPEIVIVTMNRIIGIDKWCNEPDAILRRFQTIIMMDEHRHFKLIKLAHHMSTPNKPYSPFDVPSGPAMALPRETPFVSTLDTIMEETIDKYILHCHDQKLFIQNINQQFTIKPTFLQSCKQKLSSMMARSKPTIVAQGNTMPQSEEENTTIQAFLPSVHTIVKECMNTTNFAMLRSQLDTYDTYAITPFGFIGKNSNYYYVAPGMVVYHNAVHVREYQYFTLEMLDDCFLELVAQDEEDIDSISTHDLHTWWPHSTDKVIRDMFHQSRNQKALNHESMRLRDKLYDLNLPFCMEWTDGHNPAVDALVWLESEMTLLVIEAKLSEPGKVQKQVSRSTDVILKYIKLAHPEKIVVVGLSWLLESNTVLITRQVGPVQKKWTEPISNILRLAAGATVNIKLTA